MSPRGEKGLALILVMTVVMALAIIATPFVLSMILQERTGTSARYLSQADYGADGAKSYAMWRLMMSVDPLERRGGTAPFSSYTYDTLREFEVHLDDPSLSGRLSVANPKGAIWGITVQDEQGKLNTRSCNVMALDTLSKLVDGRVVNLKDYLTLYSGRDATWVYPQRIRRQGFESGTTSGTGITVDNLAALAPGSRVRASKPGVKPIETRIRANAMLNPTRLGTNGPDGFTTEQSVAGYVDGVIEVELRHPVNVNTARRETLVALFTGLHLWDEQNGRVLAGSTVDPDSATQLATRFAGRDLQSLDQFVRALGSTSLSGPQKDAVRLNAVAPNSAWLMDSGTAPLCFKSYDVYTLEASSSMNNPAGTEVAGRGYREVVSVSPPQTLHRWCESQYDFSQMISTVSQAMAPQAGNPSKYSMSGFPYGNRLLTYPVALPGAPDISLNGAAYVTVLSAQDHRGENPDQGFNALLAGAWDDAQHNRNHYPNEMDGKKSGSETFEWKNFFAPNTTPEDEPPNVSQQRPDTGSGGFEMWAKVTSDPGSATLFDIQEQPTTNRVTLHVEGGDVILTVADSTIPYAPVGGGSDPNGKYANGVAELHLLPTKKDFRFGQETWTHFAAYWKSNRYADLALLVDGFSDPDAKFGHFTGPGGTPLLTKLSGPLDLMSTSVGLVNSSAVPQGELTPVLIGGEVILYDSGGAAAVRGARGTQPQMHPSQATASIFGYSSKIRNGQVRATYPNGYTVNMDYGRIPQTNASPSFNFGLNPQVQVAGDKMNMGPPPFYEIDNSQAAIGVLGNVMDFPDQGYIRIDNEILYYNARSAMPLGGTMPISTGQFTGCLRAQFGSVAATHRSLANIIMWSVPASNLTNYPSPTIIQIGDEWFGPVQKDPTNKNFWVGIMEGPTPHNFQRGYQCYFSIPQAHTKTEKILPTFLGRDVNSWPSMNQASMGAGDRVTLVDASNQKATARIRRTSTDPRPMLNPAPPQPVNFAIQGNAASQIVGLYDHATRDWVPDDFHVRVLKFPSGEMLSRTWLEYGSPPPVTIGPLPGGQIDEIKAFAATKGRLRMAQQANAGDARLMITATNIARRQDGGLMKIGDEYIGYVQWQDNGSIGTLNPVKNGWLNSTQELHNLGDPVFYIPWVPVAALAGDVAPEENVIRLKQHLSGDPEKYTSGYVLVDNEMLFFTWNDHTSGGNRGKTLSMPTKWDGTTGLYRGMFGTTPQNHSAQQSLAYGMPFRYFDTYKAREFDNSMLYFQWGVKMDLARWNTFKWTQEFQPATEPNLAIHALARVDNRGDFWDPPQMSDNALLVESTTGTGNVKRTSYLQEAGQFDVRFYVEYKPGSFDATMPRSHESWKRIPKIKQVQVEYDRPSQTLHHEDR